MMDRQLPDWEDDPSLDVLLGLERICAFLLQLPAEEGPADTEDSALDFLLGLVLLGQQIAQLLPETGLSEDLEAVDTLPPCPPIDLLR